MGRSTSAGFLLRGTVAFCCFLEIIYVCATAPTRQLEGKESGDFHRAGETRMLHGRETKKFTGTDEDSPTSRRRRSLGDELRTHGVTEPLRGSAAIRDRALSGVGDPDTMTKLGHAPDDKEKERVGKPADDSKSAKGKLGAISVRTISSSRVGRGAAGVLKAAGGLALGTLAGAAGMQFIDNNMPNMAPHAERKWDRIYLAAAEGAAWTGRIALVAFIGCVMHLVNHYREMKKCRRRRSSSRSPLPRRPPETAVSEK